MEFAPFIGSLDYKGKQYTFEFQITFTESQGYRAYIVRAPSYGSRSQSLAATHRLTDSGRYYICWSTTIREHAQMLAVCELWAKATVMYIADGGSSLDEHAKKIIES